MKRFSSIMLIFVFLFSCSLTANAGLFIDSTYTTPKGHIEAEFSADYYKDIEKEYDPDTEEYTKTICKETWLTLDIAYGISENWDAGVTTPYAFVDDNVSGKVNGFSDVLVWSKYRIRNESGNYPGFAIYGDIKTKSASQERSLGTGQVDYTITGILSKGIKDYYLDLNLGYIFIGGDENDILYYAFDISKDITEKLSIGAEVYGETIFERNFEENTFIAALSLAYCATERIYLETGVGFGLTSVSPDYQYSGSVTFTF